MPESELRWEKVALRNAQLRAKRSSFLVFVVTVFKFLCLPRFVLNKTLEKAKVSGAVEAGNPFFAKPQA